DTRPCPECLETIPVAAKRCRACTAVVGAAMMLVFAIVAPHAARAEDPKFQFGKTEEVKQVEYKASAKAGLLATTGNSQAATITFGTTLSRKDKDNRFIIEGGLAYARASLRTGFDRNGNGTLEPDEITREDRTTTNAWFAKGRYDRFLTELNALYVQ